MSEHDYPELTEVAPDTEMAALDAAAPIPPIAAPPEGAVLELVERGHRLALALPVFAWPCTIGRAATADLVLTDASIAPSLTSTCANVRAPSGVRATTTPAFGLPSRP